MLDPAASLRLRVARDLESGAWRGPLATIASRAWGAWSARSLARELAWPDGTRVIAIGGATLGGSGKTPLAIACARSIAATGARVALVAHGYRASPGVARVVPCVDRITAAALDSYGDEALFAARDLAACGARVVVGPTRQSALDHASAIADVAILDGPLQTRPRRASLSLLALDAGAPWGSGSPPPRGDLRAPREALLAACDRAVLVGDSPAASAPVSSAGVRVGGSLVPWIDVAHARVGLFTALARPARVDAFLARRGIFPVVHARAPDHARPREVLLPAARVDLWLASPKCALVLEAARLPHAVIDHVVHFDAPAWLPPGGADEATRGPEGRGVPLTLRDERP